MIYKRDDVFPQWEPVPWTSKGKAADEQERGFHQRALKPLLWEKIPWDQFPDSGIFGHQKAWLQEREIQYFATFEGEDFFLVDNNWFGFPDPPRWGLVSRPARQPEIAWQHWGHFPDPPDAWQFPG